MTLKLAALAAAVSTMLAVGSAAADPTPTVVVPDAAAQRSTAPHAAPRHITVRLRSGDSVAGTLVTLDAGHEVVLLPDGAVGTRALAWSDIAGIDTAPLAAAPPVAEVVATPPAQSAPGAPLTGPYVHIITEGTGVGLYRVEPSLVRGAVPGGELVCAAPCSRRIEAVAGNEYFLGGPGITGSDEFELTSRAQRIQMNVNTGGRGSRIAGVVMLVVGAINGGASGVLAAGASSSASKSELTTFAEANGAAAGVVTLVGAILCWGVGSTSIVLTDLKGPASARGLAVRF
jgi:hypothetical protein